MAKVYIAIRESADGMAGAIRTLVLNIVSASAFASKASGAIFIKRNHDFNQIHDRQRKRSVVVWAEQTKFPRYVVLGILGYRGGIL